MSEPVQHQLRVHLDGERAAAARADPRHPSLAPLPAILERHDATLVCQLDAFEAYVAQAEARGALDDPLYRWTKETVQDPAKRAKHGTAFAIRIDGREVYAEPAADALERDLKPLEGGAVVQQLSRHDTDPARTVPIPREYR